MDKYLLSLLEELHTLIIPGLGALTITNEEKGEIMFMPYLNYDDGKLVGHIVQREGMDDNEARNLISKYVRDIEARLNKGESYDMYQFGSFWKDGSGEIHFTSWQVLQAEKQEEEIVGIQPLTESVTDIQPEPITNSSPPAEEQIPSIEEIKSTTSNEETEENSKTLLAEEIKPEVKEENLQPDKPVSKRGTKEPKIKDENPKKPKKTSAKSNSSDAVPPYSEEDQWKDDLDLPPIGHKKVKPKKPILEKTKSDKIKRKTGRITLFASISVIIILSGIAYFLFKPVISPVDTHPQEEKSLLSKQEKPKSSAQKQMESKGEKKNTSLPGDSLKVSEEKESNTNKPDPKPKEIQSEISEEILPSSPNPAAESGANYHVIGAAFKEEENAKRYMDRLRSEGHSSEILGRFDRLYLVSMESYPTKDNAKKKLNELKSVSSNAWVMYYKKRL